MTVDPIKPPRSQRRKRKSEFLRRKTFRILLSILPGIFVAAFVFSANVYYDLDQGTGTVVIQNDANLSNTTASHLIVSDLTASRLIASDANKALVSTDLSSWIQGTTNQITVTDNGDGTITLSTPQDIGTSSSPTFSGLILTGDLSVSGNTTFNGVTYTWPSADGSSGQVLTTDGSGSLSWTSAAGGVSGTGSSGEIAFWTGLDTLSGNNILFWDNTNNRLGIGTTGPSSKLEVNGNVELTNLYDNDASNFFDGSGSASKTLTSISSNGALTFVDIAISESQVSGDIEAVTAGNGLTGGGTAGSVTLNVGAGNGISVGGDSVSLGSLTSDWSQSGAYDIILNNAASELKILESSGGTYYGIFDVGDLSANQTFTFTSGGTVITSGNYHSYGDITGITAGNGLTGGGTAGSVTLNVGAGDGIDVAANSVAVDVTDIIGTGLSEDGSNNLTVKYGSSAGTAVEGNTQITISAGSGLSGGGTITLGSGGSVTLSHTDTSSQGSVDNSNLSFIQDITLDTYGHITGLGSATISAGNGLTSSGTTLNVGAGDGIDVAADSIAVDVTDILGTGLREDSNNIGVYGLMAADGSPTNVVYVNNSGNVGIGTTGPSYKLDVSGDLRVTGQTIFGGVAYTWPSSDGSAGYVLQTNGSGTLSWAAAGGISGTGSASQVAFWTASDTLSGNNSLFWDNTNKRLGIGTTGPDRKLDILDSSNPQVRLSQTDGSVYGEIKVDSSGDITIIPSGNEVFIPDDNLRICSGGACPSPSYSGTGNLQVEGQIESDVANGIAPLIVNSTTLITHLNADLLDGKHASSFLTTTRVYTNFTIGTTECNDHPCKVDFDTCHKVCRQHNYLGCNKINSTASASGINCGWTMDGWSCSATGSRIASVECYR